MSLSQNFVYEVVISAIFAKNITHDRLHFFKAFFKNFFVFVDDFREKNCKNGTTSKSGETTSKKGKCREHRVLLRVISTGMVKS